MDTSDRCAVEAAGCGLGLVVDVGVVVGSCLLCFFEDVGSRAADSELRVICESTNFVLIVQTDGSAQECEVRYFTLCPKRRYSVQICHAEANQSKI